MAYLKRPSKIRLKYQVSRILAFEIVGKVDSYFNYTEVENERNYQFVASYLAQFAADLPTQKEVEAFQYVTYVI